MQTLLKCTTTCPDRKLMKYWHLTYTCDTDRLKLSNSDAYTNLIACALKGPSLPIVTLHAMLDDLQNALHRHGLNVLVECFDGQWANLCFKDCWKSSDSLWTTMANMVACR